MIPAGCLQPCWESLAIDFSLCLSVSLIQREQMKIAKSLRSAPLRKLRKRSWENGYCYLHVYLCALVIANNNIFFVVLVLVMDVCKCWVVGWCMLIHFFSSKPIKKPSFYSNYVIKETDSCGEILRILRITLLLSRVSKETMNTALEVIYSNNICAVTYIVPIWLYLQKYVLLFVNFRGDCS